MEGSQMFIRSMIAIGFISFFMVVSMPDETTLYAKSEESVSTDQKQGAQQLSLYELKNKYPDDFVFTGPSQQKWIALTFDDAPDPRYTAPILDVLKKHQVKATFFVVGYRTEQMPDTVRRIARDGHAIGNHSY